MPEQIQTIGKILFRDAVPENMRDFDKPMNKKGVSEFFTRLAENDPDKYVDTLDKLNELANETSTEYGGAVSLKLRDLTLPPKFQSYRDKVKSDIDTIAQNPKFSGEEKNKRIVEYMQKVATSLPNTLVEELQDNNFATSVKQGFRGNATQLAQMLFGDILVVDHRGRPIPVPGLHGYGEGALPIEYWAGSYGSRKGYCLHEDTLVRMADDTVKPIKDIVPGEQVLGADAEGHTFPVKVLETLFQGEKPVYSFLFKSSLQQADVVATQDHRILTVKGEKERLGLIAVLEIGVQLLHHGALSTCMAKSCSVLDRDMARTYDLHVDHPEHLFVLANGLIVSNSDVQFATQDTGYLGKTLSRMASRVRIMNDDCGAKDVGIRRDGDDPELIGSILAAPAAGLNTGALIDKSNFKRLSGKQVMVRSLLTCQLHDGVCQKCSGKREGGKFPEVGAFIGIDSARVLSEPMTQTLALCLSPDTEVRMADFSIRKLKDIQPGEKVLGASKDRSVFPVSVKAVHDNGLRDVFRFVYQKRGSESEELTLDATKEHKILAATRAHTGSSKHLNHVPRMLEAGHDYNFVSAILHDGGFNDAGFTSSQDALLLGLLLGDGCYTESVKGVFYSCADALLIEDLREYLQGLDLKLTKLGTPNYWKVSSISAKSGGRDAVSGQCREGLYTNHARRLLKDLSILHKYAHEKVLPDEVMSWDNASIAELLSGLYITDGSIFRVTSCKNEVYSYCSTSRRLVEQIKDLLQWRFGVYTGQIHSQQNASRKRPLYQITVANEHSVTKMRSVIRWRGMKAQKARAMCYTNQTLNRASLDPVASEALKQMYRCRRKSMTFLGSLPTLDLEVDHPEHLFVLANGMIVSNSAKHLGGMSTGARRDIQGFEEIDQFLQVPERFVGAATLSPEDGTISQIVPAPQGGWYMHVNQKQLYVPGNRIIEVKVGDKVEAGDSLTDGTPNPKEIGMHKGVGEGRRYFTERLAKILKDNGVPSHRRNVEPLARAFFDKVRITNPEGMDDYSPGDVVSYSELQSRYTPRKGFENKAPRRAIGEYLEKPVLHYSIGTKISTNIAKDMEEAEVADIQVHREPPRFEPEIVRAIDVISLDPDWKTRLMGTNLKKAIIQSASHGATSQHRSTSPAPGLMNPAHLGKFK